MNYYGSTQENGNSSPGCLTSSCMQTTTPQQPFHSTTNSAIQENSSTGGTQPNFLSNASGQLLGGMYVSNNQNANSAYSHCQSFHPKQQQQAYYSSNQSYDPSSGCSTQNNVESGENGMLISGPSDLQQVKAENTSLSSNVAQPGVSYSNSSMQHLLSNGQISAVQQQSTPTPSSQQGVSGKNEHKTSNNASSNAVSSAGTSSMNQSAWPGAAPTNCDNNNSLMATGYSGAGAAATNVNQLLGSGYEYVYPPLNRLYATQHHINNSRAAAAPHHYAMVSVPYNQTGRNNGNSSSPYVLGGDGSAQEHLVGAAATNTNNQRRQSSASHEAATYYGGAAKQQPSGGQQSSFYYGYPYMHLPRSNSSTGAKHPTMLGNTSSECVQATSAASSFNYSTSGATTAATAAPDGSDLKHQISSLHNTPPSGSTTNPNDLTNNNSSSSATNLAMNPSASLSSSSQSSSNMLFSDSTNKAVGLTSYGHPSSSGSVKGSTGNGTNSTTGKSSVGVAGNSNLNNESSTGAASTTNSNSVGVPSPNSSYIGGQSSARKQTFAVLDAYPMAQCGGALGSNTGMYSNFTHHPSYVSQQQQQKGCTGGVQSAGLVQHQSQPQQSVMMVQSTPNPSGSQGSSCSQSASQPGGGMAQTTVEAQSSPSQQQQQSSQMMATQNPSNSATSPQQHQQQSKQSQQHHHQIQKKGAVSNVTGMASVKPVMSNSGQPQQLVRRPRGRPRKYPTTQHYTNYSASSASPQNTSSASATMSHNSTNSFSSYEDNPMRRIQNQAERSKYANNVLEHLRCFSEFYMQQLCEEQLEELHHPSAEVEYSDDVCEEYLACGGPFTRLATASFLHQQGKVALHVTEEDEEPMKQTTINDDIIKQTGVLRDKEVTAEGGSASASTIDEDALCNTKEHQQTLVDDENFINDRSSENGAVQDKASLLHKLDSNGANVIKEDETGTKLKKVNPDIGTNSSNVSANQNNLVYNYELKNEQTKQEQEHEREQDEQQQQHLLHQNQQQQSNEATGKEVYDLDEAFKRVFNVNEKQQLRQTTTISYLNSNRNVINLNQSFLWAGLNPKVPVRDLVISRHHMAILLNNQQVYLHRHFTHPLVTTQVATWEHLEFFDCLNIVSLRLTSALLSENWRQEYHEHFRKKKIEQICQELTSKNISLPLNPLDYDCSEEFLNFLIENHPEGILAYHLFDPNWLPEPCVLVALDQSGVMHAAKCYGYYNYPSMVLEYDISPSTFNEQKFKSSSATSSLQSNENELSQLCSPKIVISNPTSMIQVDNRVLFDEKKETTMQEDCDVSSSKLIVQDLALAELTKDALMSGEDLGIFLVMYSANEEETDHSVYVKGKNMFVRFKNFPTGPAKLYCSPLGYTGALLLANGTVWSWSAQSTNCEKVTAVIRQVGGSLTGRHVIDLACLGADFIALTSDGIVHEWNNYAPYLMYHSDKITNVAVDLPYILVRPMISEPIELTPSFQNEVLSSNHSSKAEYQIRQFSWIYSGIGRQQATAAANDSATGNSSNSVELSQEKPSFLCSATRSTDDGTKLGMSAEGVPPASSDNVDGNDSADNFNSSSSCNKKVVQDPHLVAENVEKALELTRQNEITRLYSGNKPKVDRVFLTEGVTIFIRNGVIDVLPNSLGGYHGSSHSYWESQAFGKYGLTCSDITPLVCKVGKQFENHLPLPVNPVLMAQMNLTEKPCEKKKKKKCSLVAAGEQNSSSVNNLRAELLRMASSSPPQYRLLVSPVSIVVSTLKRFHFCETIQSKKRIEAQLPLLVAAYSPSLYLQAFTNITSSMLASNFLSSSQRISTSSVSGVVSNSDGTAEKRRVLPAARRLKTGVSTGGKKQEVGGGGGGAVDDSPSNDELSLGTGSSEQLQQQQQLSSGNNEEGSSSGLFEATTTNSNVAVSTGGAEAAVEDADTNDSSVRNAESVAAAPAGAAATAAFYDDQAPVEEIGSSKSFGTNKRHRRHSATFDGQNYITGFAGDSDGSEEAWEQILSTLDEDKQPQKKKKSGRKKKKISNFAMCNDDTSSKSEDLSRLSVSAHFTAEIGGASAGA